MKYFPFISTEWLLGGGNHCKVHESNPKKEELERVEVKYWPILDNMKLKETKNLFKENKTVLLTKSHCKCAWLKNNSKAVENISTFDRTACNTSPCSHHQEAKNQKAYAKWHNGECKQDTWVSLSKVKTTQDTLQVSKQDWNNIIQCFLYMWLLDNIEINSGSYKHQ